MNIFRNLLLVVIIIGFLQSCNTLYSFRLIDIEVAEPGKLMLPEKYSTAVLRYNNIGDLYSNENQVFYYNTKAYSDTLDLDSIAARLYFSSVFENLNKQFYFDSVTVLKSTEDPRYYFSDSLISLRKTDTLNTNESVLFPSVSTLAKIINQNSVKVKSRDSLKLLDPKYGLYTQEDLKQIADSNHADLLMSLDYFSSVDIRSIQKIGNSLYVGNTVVYGIGLWNFYNLNTGEPAFFYSHLDSLIWTSENETMRYAEKDLPSRENAVLNIADEMGIRFAEKLIPHWVSSQRLYYVSGHVELKKTKQLINEGKWVEAAKIWKANVNNPNKKIAAKSMFNLGVACEMEGDPDAAIDWIVRSYRVLGNKNNVHYLNCTDYINILAQRKLDIKLIDKQINGTL